MSADQKLLVCVISNVYKVPKRLTSWNKMARPQRVPGMCCHTRTTRSVIGDKTVRVNPASPRTRILALLVDARLVFRAIRVHDAFGSTPRVRIAVVLRQAAARTCAVPFFTDRIWPAGRRVAGMPGFLHCLHYWNNQNFTVPRELSQFLGFC